MIEVLEVNYNELPLSNKRNIILDIFERRYVGIIIKNFLTEDEINTVKKVLEYNSRNRTVSNTSFLNSLPRPFNSILASDYSEYVEECNNYTNYLDENRILDKFKQVFELISKDIKVNFASPSSTDTFSKSWSSVRIQINGFQVFPHCGIEVQAQTEQFFNYMRGSYDVKQQLAFLMVLEKATKSESDLDIYNIIWDEYPSKTSNEFVCDKNGEEIPFHKFKRKRINLNLGDVIIFNEGTFWHAVSKIVGDGKRISFGGFITKNKYESKALMWV